jgi:predicted neutral ceramidase superfamily lipid hydrolase
MVLFVLIIVISVLGVIVLSDNGANNKCIGNEDKYSVGEELICAIKAFIIIGIIIALIVFTVYTFLKAMGEGMFAWLDPFVDAMHESHKHG